MNTREQILNAVAANKPSLLPLPEIDIRRNIDRSRLTEQFITMLTKIGGRVSNAATIEDIKADIEQCRRNGENVIDTIYSTPAGLPGAGAAMLETVDRAYVEGTFGVAENGAVWLYESKMVNRLLPFICQHLVIVLKTENIVADMHEAYRQTDVAKEGYGVFLAGPSKTADIEQSLVIGAHGARSLHVFLLG